MTEAVSVGYCNTVATSKVVSVTSASSAPVRRLISEMIDSNKVIDATQGRKTRSVVYTDGERIILSAVRPETLARRLWGNIGGEEDEVRGENDRIQNDENE